MGQAKALKIKGEEGKPGFYIDHDDFPDITGDKNCPGTLGKEIPDPMLAYTATSVRLFVTLARPSN